MLQKPACSERSSRNKGVLQDIKIMNKIKKNDTVIKMVGVERVLVEGINIVKKNVKPNPNKRIQGGIVEKEASIHVSNVALLNPMTKKADRVGFKTLEATVQGEKPRKVRYFKSN